MNTDKLMNTVSNNHPSAILCMNTIRSIVSLSLWINEQKGIDLTPYHFLNLLCLFVWGFFFVYHNNMFCYNGIYIILQFTHGNTSTVLPRILSCSLFGSVCSGAWSFFFFFFSWEGAFRDIFLTRKTVNIRLVANKKKQTNKRALVFRDFF